MFELIDTICINDKLYCTCDYAQCEEFDAAVELALAVAEETGRPYKVREHFLLNEGEFYEIEIYIDCTTVEFLTIK